MTAPKHALRVLMGSVVALVWTVLLAYPAAAANGAVVVEAESKGGGVIFPVFATVGCIIIGSAWYYYNKARRGYALDDEDDAKDQAVGLFLRVTYAGQKRDHLDKEIAARHAAVGEHVSVVFHRPQDANAADGRAIQGTVLINSIPEEVHRQMRGQ
ncbi:MAG: hypothetical protein LBH68_08500 [Bifidobacteriaceae bacterium]|jgi:hypothetical protein|nr:hypothetical protein [Bifidobacteriaceae bacterium]